MCLGGNKAAKQAAAQSAADNQAAIDAANKNTALMIAESQRASEAALAEQRAASEAQLQQQQEQSASLIAAAVSQANAAWAQQQAILAEQAKATEQTRLTGNKAKAPNVQGLMDANKKAGGSGNSSTLLTGPGGVANSSLPLAKNSLLGS